MKLLTRLLLATGMTVAVAAGGCEDGNNVIGGSPAPEKSFGATFTSAFNAAATAEPINPTAGDLPPVDLTSEPINF